MDIGYYTLSTHLNKVLDAVGASEDIRKKHREEVMIKEILCTLMNQFTTGQLHQRITSTYMFGSKSEGTTTPGLHSDIDIVKCFEVLPVIEDVMEAPRQGPACLMVADQTKPGYVNLQSVINMVPQTVQIREASAQEEADSKGRILIKHFNNPFPTSNRNGPADTVPPSEVASEMDFVDALRCQTIPVIADLWLKRPRTSQWPSKMQLERMGSFGCLFVGVGHPQSHRKSTEWRISFSLQERELMFSLSPTQHKCYILLKMIKKDIITPSIGKSLSSYHCKTCIFHLTENTEAELWAPQNLISCVHLCLRQLLEWIREGNCPNYFIKEENMFDRINRDVLKKIEKVLINICGNGVAFLFKLTSENVGFLLNSSLLGTSLMEKECQTKRMLWTEVFTYSSKTILSNRLLVYRYMNDVNLRPIQLSRMASTLKFLENATAVTEHETTDVRMTVELMLPHLRLQMKQTQYAMKLNLIESNEPGTSGMNDFGQETGMNVDLFSSKLIDATFCLQTHKLSTCEKILAECGQNLKSYVTSLCECDNIRFYDNVALKTKIYDEKLSVVDFIRNCTAACLIFLPSQAHLVHPALWYEMYRSAFTPPGSRHGIIYFWFDWIAIDSKVYLYFLQYLLFSTTNQPGKRQNAVDSLARLVSIKHENLGHRETAYNLLGWIHTQENRNQEAIECFYLSWRVRPVHNAGKWHLAILINSLLN